MINQSLRIYFVLSLWSTVAIGQDFYRNPTSKDSTLLQTHSHLLGGDPTEAEASEYYLVAEALWKLGRIQEAKAMFLAIVASSLPIYTTDQRKASDLSGDNSQNLNGYGSYTFHYKHWACTYLAKICIEQKEFLEAGRFMDLALDTYPVSYFCGTGSRMAEDRNRELSGRILAGLGEKVAALDLLLPHCFSFSGQEVLLEVLKSLYTQDELKGAMEVAIHSLEYAIHEHSTTVYLGNAEDDQYQAVTYITGSGTVELFGRTVALPCPVLAEGEVVTRQDFVEDFLSSRFYMDLTGDYSHSLWKASFDFEFQLGEK